MSPDRVKKKRERGSSLRAQAPPRVANRIFYVVAEGAVTEYDYLTMVQNEFSVPCSFRIDMPKARPDDMKPCKVAEHVLTVADEDARRSRGERYAEIWALFDRDQHRDVGQALDALSGHPKIRVAFSSPSFDFWLYLHYGMYDVPQSGCNDHVHRLLAQRPAFAGFGGKDKRITRSRAEDLLPRVGKAYANARNLGMRCASGACAHPGGAEPGCDLLDQDPSSGMWRLLDSLGVSARFARDEPTASGRRRTRPGR
ncbi:RloB family protein [Nonomuraea sp. C10]|uniref:RloB family protein n=1 Tax=Nonomuraea sp. C10 TaxID=2600577 RepID=UPI00164F5CC0|nr:RloB family protein [Nonomuraea sp. C10]